MAKTKPSLKQIEQLIHRTYHLYTNTIDLIERAECEEKLLHLFEMKRDLEKEKRELIITAWISKRKVFADLRKAVLIAGGKFIVNRRVNSKGTTPTEPIAN
ncbi:hypothetical protein [Paenibacillus taichungensis]